MRLRRAFHFGTAAEQDSAAVEAARVPGLLAASLLVCAASSERPDVALRLAAANDVPGAPLFLGLAVGRWAGLPPSAQVSGRTQVALLFAAPGFANISMSERDSMRRRVERLPVSDDYGVLGIGSGRVRPPGLVVISRPYRDYLLGLLSARLGDAERALAHARRLDSYRDDGGDEWRDASRDFSASIRATVRLAQGRAAEGLTEIERAPMRAPLVSMNAVQNRVYERFLRAELLHAVGRDEEALRWYSTLHCSGNQGIAYLAPCHLRQAQIHERMGHVDEAILHYRRFVELWKDCDPELRPEVDRARKRLDALVVQAS